MPAASFNFELEQGSDFQIVFNYLDSNSNPVNLTNMHVLLRFKDNNGIDYSFDNVTETSDYSLTTTSNGLITLLIPAKITDGYTFESAQYELDIQEPNETYAGSGTKSNRILFGDIVVIARLLTPPTRSDLTIFPGDKNSCPPVMLSDAIVYEGSSLTIADNSVVSNSITITNTNNIQNIEVGIQGLNHTNVQDLNIFLKYPGAGDNAILLVGSEKFNQYTPGFSFIVSDRAESTTSAYSVADGGLFKATDKTNYIRFRIPILSSDSSGSGSGSGSGDSDPVITGYTDQTLLHSFDSISGSAAGDWTLFICDHDNNAIGFISGWKLYITYEDIFA
tara:strand:+ start:484 stop:1488 length:1005 start_codon:yes stop_codon:yes gene_type:complete